MRPQRSDKFTPSPNLQIFFNFSYITLGNLSEDIGASLRKVQHRKYTANLLCQKQFFFLFFSGSAWNGEGYFSVCDGRKCCIFPHVVTASQSDESFLGEVFFFFFKGNYSDISHLFFLYLCCSRGALHNSQFFKILVYHVLGLVTVPPICPVWNKLLDLPSSSFEASRK